MSMQYQEHVLGQQVDRQLTFPRCICPSTASETFRHVFWEWGGQQRGIPWAKSAATTS